MTDASTFGGGTAMDGAQDTGSSSFGSGLGFGGGGGAAAGPGDNGADVPPAAPKAPPAAPTVFGSGIGAHYTPPDPQTTALDQTADMLEQRVKRANAVASNPILQFFSPEGVQAARSFIPQATEQLQKIKQQKADMAANRQQAATLGLAPGEVADEASQADRVEVAKAKALQGDLRVFKGLQAVDPKSAEAIQDQVHETVAGHLTKAQFAFDKLSNMRNEGEYGAAVNSLRQDGTLTDLERLGVKVPGSFDAFNASKAREGQALREARIGVDTMRQKLEDRNTYQPMEEKEAKTYNGRMTTLYGDQVTNGTWSNNKASGTRGLVVNGASDPRELGKSFTLATPEQRKAIKEEFDEAVPKEDREKYRAFNRTYQLATTDAKGNAVAADKINTNPNVQQGVAEGLASMLRGGSGGANVGLLKIELAKRGWAQGAIDGLVGNYAGAVNTMFANADKPYLSAVTQKQIRDVMDVLKTYNDSNIGDRTSQIAQRAGALGLDSAALGFGKSEATGVVGDALKAGRDAQVARMLPYHQAIGSGDGVFQLGAQRPGAGATSGPPGSATTTQLPGATPLQTPVQQSQNPPAPVAPSSTPAPGGGAPSAGAPSGGPGATGPAGGSPPPQPAAPVTIAGQQVSMPALPPGASPNYLHATQRIESGREKDPWKAGNDKSSAGGAFQFINSTWAADKPPGAPDKARDATPQQQTEAAAVRATKNAAVLTKAGIPVNDTSLYVAHNLGEGAGPKLLTADPNADARTVVGEAAARNNPLFFRGKPTVQTVLARYDSEMKGGTQPPAGVKPLPGSDTAASGQPSFLQRISRALSQGIPGDGAAKDAAVKEVGDAATEHAPAIASTLGAVAGSAAGPAGTMAGGGAGGSAGQMLKDYLQGSAQSPARIAKEGALGTVLGVGGPARPVLSAVARATGAGAVEAGADAMQNGVTPDTVDAGLKGAANAAGGELFGRALGMAGHKVFSMFAPDAKAAVQMAAKSYAEATATLKTETPKLPGVGGAAGGPNPKYEAAEAAKVKAETTLKDAGLVPEEAAYAHKVAGEGVPKQEAEAARPGAVEQERVGAGYKQLETEVGAAGTGAVKPTPKLADGPRAAVENKQVSATHAELADHVEMAITAPAKNWQEKWTQLKDARSQLLQAERDAMSSTSPGRTKTAQDMRTLADTVRTQQAEAAKYVFGEKDGEAFMARLKVLDVRYRNLMEATNNGDLAKAAVMKGEPGREAERKFVAFAHDDPQAIAAYRAMRGIKGDLAEATVPWTVAVEGLPVVGKVVKAVKLAGLLKEWARERTAGSAVKFSDLVKTNEGAAGVGQNLRDLGGTAVQRGATM